MVIEITHMNGASSQQCPVCYSVGKVIARGKQEFLEKQYEKYAFVCSSCLQLWWATLDISGSEYKIKMFLPTADLDENLFPDESWQYESIELANDVNYPDNWENRNV
jgi:hypothetical protein